MNPDFVDLLRALGDADVRFMIVGAYALDFLDRDSFVRNKRATGRLKDLSDVEGMD